MGTEDVKVTAMNMYKYKERLRLYKRWPCSRVICNALLQALVKILWQQKRRGKFSMAHLLPIHHETLQRKDWEAGKGR